MIPEIRLSVALVTRNGPERLRCCLESLRTQSVQPFEVVVSDDSNDEFAPRTRIVCEQYGGRYVEGPRRGLYANRNQAALACRGTHIRTVDDDHTFPEGHFATCLEFLKSDPESIWTTGELLLRDGVVQSRAATANQLHPSGLGSSPKDLDDNWTIADGSTIYPASLFARGFRMLEQYGYGSSYLEFGALLYSHGYRCRCIPCAPVEHHAGAETISRQQATDRRQIESHLFASLAFNLYFKPALFSATKYLLAALWSSRFDPILIARVPVIIWAVYKRWRCFEPLPFNPS